MVQGEVVWSIPECDTAAWRFSGKLFTNDHTCIAPGSEAGLQKISWLGLQLNNNSAAELSRERALSKVSPARPGLPRNLSGRVHSHNLSPHDGLMKWVLEMHQSTHPAEESGGERRRRTAPQSLSEPRAEHGHMGTTWSGYFCKTLTSFFF